MALNNYDPKPTRIATVDEDAEWQRVNSYVADVLKDCYVLFAKLSRLRGDFMGHELEELDKVASRVRDIGSALTIFSKAFTEGEYHMNKKEQFGNAPSEPNVEDFDFTPIPESGKGGHGEPEVQEPDLEEFGAEEEGAEEKEKKSKKEK